MSLRFRCLLLMMTFGLVGCSADVPLPPAWPESGRADLHPEVLATAGVQVREGEAAGLHYYEVVIGDVDIDARLPLVMMIHGRGDRPRVPGGPFAGVPTPLRIVLPRGPDPLGDGYAWLPVRTLDGKTEILSRALAARSDQLAELLAHVLDERPTIGTPIVTGFSQGGMLSYTMAIRHRDAVGAAIPLASWLPPPLRAAGAAGAERPRIRAMHGTADTIIPFAYDRETVDQLASLGHDVELAVFRGVGHEMTPEMNALFEAWLEAALALRAPTLEGGPGEPGPDEPAGAVSWEN